VPPPNFKIYLLIICFVPTLSLNSGLCTCKVSTLLLEPHF
jgi:hypothetical protein